MSTDVDPTKPLIIVNPRARGRFSEGAWARVVGGVTDGLGPLEVRFTERPGHARQIAADERARGRKLVVACGGDGTISEIVDGLLSRGPGVETELGIIPRGTGGDFRRTLGLPEDLAAAARHIATAAPCPIDVGRVTFVGHDGAPASACFVNVASFGYSAEVGGRANRSSKRLGAKAAFIGAAVRTLLSYDNVEVWVSIDGDEPRRRRLLLGAIGNGKYFGGGMKICPDATLDDGRLDVMLVGDLGRFEVLGKFSRIYAGTHTSMPEVEPSKAVRVEVTPVDPETHVALELDGETPGRLPATFEILPKALRIRF